jgi:hypothetical protein
VTTVSAVVKGGRIALSEPVNWPEGTEVLVRPVNGDDADSDSQADPLQITIRHLSAILRELIDAQSGPERDDYGVLRPTKHAFAAASQLLIDAAMAAASGNRRIPLGSVSTDSQGGVRVEWVRDRSSVHLVVPGPNHEPPYIYHELGSDYATEDATAERLAIRLREID